MDSRERTVPRDPSTASGPAIVSVRNLTKTYRLYDSPRDRLKEAIHPFRRKYHRDHDALRDMSFEIGRGETVGIIGRNGSGKSTLLKLITGVLTPTRGSVDVKGRVSAMLELGTGFNPEFTGIENVYLGGALMGYTRKEMDARLDAILAFADIGEYARQPVKSYSSGMFVRLAFAVMTVLDPDVLVLDEVLAVGDIAFQNKCLRTIARLAESGGTTILFVTHDMNALRLLCDRALLLDGGRLVMDAPPFAVIDRYADLLFKGPAVTRTEVMSVGIADETNVFVDRVASRGPYSVVIDIGRLEVEKGLLLAIRFINLENRFNYRLETDRFLEMRGTLADRRLVAGFRELNLPKGHYTLNVALSDGTFINLLHRIEEAIRFQVVEDGTSAPFLSADWREEGGRRKRMALVGWWGGGNEGDRYIREVLGRSLGDRFNIHPVETHFEMTEAALGALNEADVVLVGGGGLFTRVPPKPFESFAEWKGRLRAPLAFVGVGVETVGPGHAGTIREIVESSVAFVVRDQGSLDLVRPLSPRAAKGPDLTFLYPRRIERAPDPVATGVNLRIWDYDEERRYDNAAWCEAINALPGEKETIPLSFAERLRDADAMRGIRGRQNSRFDMDLYRNLRVLVGMRLHSLVFAVQNGIPAIGIAYAPKVRRFLAEVGLEEYCLGVDEPGRLGELHAMALRNSREISDRMMRYTEEARLAATGLIEALKEKLSRP